MSLAAPAPWAPPNLRGTPDASALWNVLASRLGRELSLRGSARATVELATVPTAEADAIAVRFEAGPSLLVVPLAFPFTALFDADLAIADLPLLPDALRAALTEGVVEGLAALLPDHGLGAHALVARGSAADLAAGDGAPLRWFRVTIHGFAPEAATILVGAGTAALGAIFGGTLPLRPVWPGLREAITREADFTLGRLVLPLAGLRRLAPGSVVLLDAGVGTAAPRLRIGEELFHFEAAGDGWTCTGIAALDAPAPDPAETARTAIAMTSPTTTAPDVPTVADGLERLDVAVDIDLGRITVPLAELETWGPGSIVALRPPEAHEGVAVVLRANGRAIGAGEIVRIDDRLAVRVTRLAL